MFDEQGKKCFCFVFVLFVFYLFQPVFSRTAIPDIPVDVTIPSNNISTFSLSVKWKAGYNGGITQWFLIQYQTADTNRLVTAHNITESEGQQLYSREITGLSAGTTYLIYVSSGNTIGNNFEKIKPVQVVTKSK